jgi:cytochrome b6-f complex iron-sulfur subunit
MERRKFIKTCCYTAAGLPFIGLILQSCGTIYYASFSKSSNKLVVAKSEFIEVKKEKEILRKFILIKPNESGFPICIYRLKDNKYTASLLKCTHNGCELNVGGGIYTCPCHGAEFSTSGQVLQGPAERNLETYHIETDTKKIYVYVS